MIYQSITELIGNTPLLKIDPTVHGLKNIQLYAKLESYNPFGSLKDRIAWEMIRDDLAQIKAKGQTIIESSSGNTAKALQGIAAIHGIPFKTVTNRIKVPEVKQILQVMGAQIEQMPGKSECPDPDDPNDPLIYIQNLVDQNPEKYYYTTQYTNLKNIQAHFQTTGQELVNDLGQIDYFFGGLGTTGSTRGTAQFIQQHNPHLVSVGIVSSIDDYIPGIRTITEMWEVGLFEKDFYAGIEEVSSLNALDSMLTLIRMCGILAGPTSGASYAGTLNYLQRIDPGLSEPKTAVFIVCDRFEYYMSYIKDRKPELFGEKAKSDTIKNLTADQVAQAKSMDPIAAQSWIQEHAPLIIDIRSNIAYKAAHLPGSVNIPQTQLLQLIEGYQPFSNDQPILIACPIGDQSLAIAAYLQSKGYQAFSLKGGVTAWRDSGFALERSVSKGQINE